jgi:RHS repeat-associated protein
VCRSASGPSVALAVPVRLISRGKENRLVRVESRSDTPQASWRRVEWTYGPLWRRIRQTTSVWTNNAWAVVEDLEFISDPLLFGRHIAELNGSDNALVRTYVWGLDLSGAEQGAGGIGGLLWFTQHTGANVGSHCCAYDGNGNVVVLVSASDGSLTARYEYGPFAEPIRVSGPAAAMNPLRFSTKRTDSTTDLVLYEYRAYNPVLGFWLSRDPIGEYGGRQLHGFVRNAPTISIDLLGLFGPIPEGFALCRRNIDKSGMNKFDRLFATLIDCCGGEHTYVQYARYPPPPQIGPPYIWGIGFSGGQTVTEETKFNPSVCFPCIKNGSKLKYGSGSGKPSTAASDDEIKDCLSNRKPDRPYSFPRYVCSDWAKQAVRDCGLSCN